MAIINELIEKIDDKALREQIKTELSNITSTKKFGLVFENHLPECVPLYGVPIRKGLTVAKKDTKITDLYLVASIKDDIVTCVHKQDKSIIELPESLLVPIASFDDPIYPQLIPMDKVENNRESGLWHTLIEADNYHALQLLEYLYPQQVDCIYIDPPYNTGARDWKYNNDYVDSTDNWRHSKWLSMMERRLKVAKRILNPQTGVLIATIDEHEVHHLRTLLESIFPEAYIQMVTIVVNPKGVTQGRFSRVEEYAIFCFMPNAYVVGGDDPLLGEKRIDTKPRWKGLLRSGTNARREDRKNMFYPVLIDPNRHRVIRAGESVPFETHVDFSQKIEGYDVAWPIRTDGSEGNWGVSNSKLNELIEKGYVALGKFDSKRNTWAISYLSQRPQKQIESGELSIISYDESKNVVTVEYTAAQEKQIKSVWHRSSHDAGVYGSDLVSNIIGQSRAFSFPKSIYSTKDAIAAVVRTNKNALIVDFFAGSGTTLNAVNLLNEEDGGSRRCIIVTNNECSEEDAKDLSRQGLHPGDAEWENRGICQAVTWPRTKYSINGHNDDLIELDGEYLTSTIREFEKNRNFTQISYIQNASSMSVSQKKQLLAICARGILPQNLVTAGSKYVVSHNEKHTISILFDDSAIAAYLDALDGMDHITDFYIVTTHKAIFDELKKQISELLGNIITYEQVKRPLKEGFPANCEYFKLGFLDKDVIELGKGFRAILPMLWLQSGAVGRRPQLLDDALPEMLIPEDSTFAILLEEYAFADFKQAIVEKERIQYVYLVTDSEVAFTEMASQLSKPYVKQLYRDYIDNFTLNIRRT